MKHLIISLLLISLSMNQGCKKEPNESPIHTISGLTMGTTFSIKLLLPGKDNPAVNDLKTKIQKRLKTIESQLSAHKKSSEISHFNRFRGKDWFPVSLDIAKVVQYSLYISNLSNGAFDITAGPLVNLWGFGPERKIAPFPDSQVIQKTKKIVSYKNLGVRLSSPAIKKRISGLNCNLSAIAKGYGIDSIARLLDHNKINNYMVEIGGEVKAKGKKSENIPWRIGIASPSGKQAEIRKVITLYNMAVATSGDYQNYYKRQGRRYSHSIDPRTGYPIAHELASVTVVHESCMHADAMATAISILGPHDGYKLAVDQDLAVFFIIRQEKKFIERMTPGFNAILAKDKSSIK